jgi:hypothetical protein
MPEGIEQAAGEFAKEVAPASRPRDQAGKFVATKERPEPMFGERPIEGDERGDTSDGGDNERLRAREREIANQRPEPREPDDDDVEDVDHDPDRIGGAIEPDDDDRPPAATDEGEKYEVTIDGETREVSVEEALRGYIREETFHKRQKQLFDVQKMLETEYGRLQQNWGMWDKARRDYEEDLGNMIPREPNWDEKFRLDPHKAWEEQKVYQLLYSKLAASQQARGQREAAQMEENHRRLERYKVESEGAFYAMHPKIFTDEATKQKNLQSMRRTALAAGFTDPEVDSVFDPRMLTILLKASKYDRIQASKPKPVIVDRGKTLIPGAATPLGNVRRSGIDDAQRRLASSGKLEDAVDVFRKML